MNVKITECEAAWVAGFLEGEGYFTLSPDRWRIGASQVNREPLDRLQGFFGGSIYSRPAKPPRQAWHTWEVSGKRTCLIITLLILPWLSDNRLERIPWFADTLTLHYM